MSPSITRQSKIISLSAVALLAGLAACSAAQNASVSTNPQTQSESRYRVVQPDKKPFAPTEAVLGSKRIKGRIQNLEDSELKTSVTGYTFELGSDTDSDGAANEHAEGDLEIDGLGKHHIVLEQENYPVMSNQADQVTVKDDTSGNVRSYSADQDMFNYSVSDGTHTLNIQTLPDGTWMVDDEAAATPAAAAELALKSPLLADASAHGLMLMYETFNQSHQIPVEFLETLAPIHCTTTTPNGMNAGPSFGDPRPLMKEILKLKIAGN